MDREPLQYQFQLFLPSLFRDQDQTSVKDVSPDRHRPSCHKGGALKSWQKLELLEDACAEDPPFTKPPGLKSTPCSPTIWVLCRRTAGMWFPSF